MVKKGSKKKDLVWLGLIFLFVISVLIYYRSFKVGLLSDDFDIVFDYKSFINPFSSNRWLFLQGIYYWFLNFVHLKVIILRVIFFGFHLLNIFLVYWFTFLVSKKKNLAFLAAFIFSLFYRHPMSIFWIAGSLEILLLTFSLSSIIFYTLYLNQNRVKFYLLSIIFFILALLCKESAIVVLPVIFIIQTFYCGFKGRKLGQIIKEYLPFVFSSIIYLLITLFSMGSNFILERGGYHAIGFQQAIINYANILSEFLPIKFDQDLIHSLPIAILVVSFLIVVLLVSLIIKKIPRIISISLGVILITSSIYALFSTFGPQDKYLTLPSLGFSLLIASSLWFFVESKKFFGGRVVVAGFCVVYAVFAIKLIDYRSEQWLTADREVKNIQHYVKAYCENIKFEKEGYLVNFPLFIGNQVFVLNNGLQNMMKSVCLTNFPSFELVNDSSAIEHMLDGEDNRDSNRSNLVLYYNNGNIENFSSKTDAISQYFRGKINIADLYKFEDWSNQPSDGSNVRLSNSDSTLVVDYEVSEGKSACVAHRFIPTLSGAKGLSVEVNGDGRGETIYVDFIDRQTGAYVRFSDNINWNGPKQWDILFKDGSMVGSDIDLNHAEDFRVCLDSAQKVNGRIEIGKFAFISN